MVPLGEIATYIPELGKADKNQLGIAHRMRQSDFLFQLSLPQRIGSGIAVLM